MRAVGSLDDRKGELRSRSIVAGLEDVARAEDARHGSANDITMSPEISVSPLSEAVTSRRSLWLRRKIQPVFEAA